MAVESLLGLRSKISSALSSGGSVADGNVRTSGGIIPTGKAETPMIILTVGAVWQSDYERYAHAAVARKAGISEEAIRTLMAGGLPDDLSEPEKLAQRYTLQLATEHRIDTALYHEAEQAFGQEGLVNLAYLAGIYHLVCGLLNSFEIPAPA
jgi:4-carboxymuconolactone decarboxylase